MRSTHPITLSFSGMAIVYQKENIMFGRVDSAPY